VNNPAASCGASNREMERYHPRYTSIHPQSKLRGILEFTHKSTFFKNRNQRLRRIRALTADFWSPEIKPDLYLALILFWVRIHLVQRWTFFDLPSTTTVAAWTLGSKRRLVCCLEWLTFSPNIGDFPQISHFKVYSP
jgi:hypothetical protein